MPTFSLMQHGKDIFHFNLGICDVSAYRPTKTEGGSSIAAHVSF
jgi:hypothetical protein